ncbi:LysR family transcriptional regulator [Labedella populi]|uniref:LysR family transcriptional regulator n=1 Tax=Labedella populi TaxID=2498850 RepID=A0A444QE72_9MICO|nr:LysR family transcriptional regulator [Labedella populi]RWZ67886.1 LysR family transcriptional regulator [Labedella populi]
METADLRHFLAVAAEGHYSRAANREHVSRATIQSSIAALETELGRNLVSDVEDGVVLTDAGTAFVEEAAARVAKAPTPPVNRGGKAKASKGKGRAPIVKGEPKPFKKRQGR